MIRRFGVGFSSNSFSGFASPSTERTSRFGGISSPSTGFSALDPMFTQFSGGREASGSIGGLRARGFSGMGNTKRIADENPIEPIVPDGKAMAQAPAMRASTLLAPSRTQELMLGTKKLLGQ
jgi:hypothetical protein